MAAKNPFTEDAPKRPSKRAPLDKRIAFALGITAGGPGQAPTTSLGNIITPEVVNNLPSEAKKVIKLLLDRNEALEKAARIDLKTGLPNDDDCREELQRMMDNRPRVPNKSARSTDYQYPLPTVVLLDMNGLKKINDTYSHAAGDLAIKHIADVLKNNNTLRNNDYVARAGIRSDEFTIILKATEPKDAKKVMDKIIDKIRKTPIQYSDTSGRPINITISACYGMAQMIYGDNIKGLRERVSQSLHEAKDQHYGRTTQNPVKKEDYEFGAGIPGIDPSLPSASGETWQQHTRNPPSPTSGKSSAR